MGPQNGVHPANYVKAVRLKELDKNIWRLTSGTSWAELLTE